MTAICASCGEAILSKDDAHFHHDSMSCDWIPDIDDVEDALLIHDIFCEHFLLFHNICCRICSQQMAGV